MLKQQPTNSSYSLQSPIIRLHPDLPLVAKALDFDIEITDLTSNDDQPLSILKFPFTSASWKILDVTMLDQWLFAAVSVKKGETQIVAWNLNSMAINSQVALHTGKHDTQSVHLVATPGRVFALANHKSHGYSLFIMSFKILGLEITDERSMSEKSNTEFFV